MGGLCISVHVLPLIIGETVKLWFPYLAVSAECASIELWESILSSFGVGIVASVPYLDKSLPVVQICCVNILWNAKSWLETGCCIGKLY